MSALFKSATSSNVILRLVPDSLDMIESEKFNALLTFICEKSKANCFTVYRSIMGSFLIEKILETIACESIPVINYTTFKIVSNFQEMDYLVYDCIPGYKPVKGDRIRMCNLDGKWRGHDLECTSKLE